MRNGWFLRIVVIAALESAYASLNAQTTAATLRGTVLDPSSAPVPQGEVKAVNVDTGFARSVFTNDAGDYVIADLPYGTYKVFAVKPGFQQLVGTAGTGG